MVGESYDGFTIQVLVVQTFAVSCVKIQALTHLFVKVGSGRRQRGPGDRAPLDFHIWYRYSR